MILRPATLADATGMVAVLNPLIAEGSTTAHRTPFDAARMRDHYIASPFTICTHVADTDGTIVGFQTLEWPDPAYGPMPDGWAFIASFVAPGHGGQGIGRALFAQTLDRARAAGVQVIDATIRADNASGLGYYSALGFVDFDRLTGVPLSDGTPVDRIRKRFDL